MAFLNEENKLWVEIPSSTFIGGVTLYEVQVHVGAVQWQVRHRYSVFEHLHQQLSSNHGVSKHLLPPKKLLGNKDPVFVDKRRLDLQSYLQSVVGLMGAAVVEELAEFLQLKYYELLHLRRRLALAYSHRQPTAAEYTPLEMHAISHALAHPAPAHRAPAAAASDFCHLADAAAHHTALTVRGSPLRYKSSNIVPNDLEFNFNLFKSITTLNLLNVNISKISDASTVRSTVCKLNALGCSLQQLSHLVFCDTVYRDLNECDEKTTACLPKWPHLKDLNLSDNQITSIDLSVSFCNRLETINLSGNRLTSLDYLTKLPYLISVVVSNNAIVELPDLHTKLGNLVHLDISRNKMTSLRGLASLYSLVSLDVSCNMITDVSEVSHVARLPCLEDFLLTGNPVTTIVDYRTKVLECFGTNCSELCLDNERPTQRELDKVAVLQALRAARENTSTGCRLPTLNITTPVHQHTHNTSSSPGGRAPDIATAAEEGTYIE